MTNMTALWMGLLVGSLGNLALADDFQKVINVQKIRDQISRADAGWKTKESWVTRLSRGEVQRMLGLEHLPVGTLNFESVQIKGISNLPASIDWRNKDGINWLGPVMNQGGCGSCVAFSTLATLEAQVSISSGGPWLHPSFSPQELFSCGGGSCDRGWDPDSAAHFLEFSGVADEACMPYTSGSSGDDMSCNQKCSDSRSRSFKIAGFSTPTTYGGSIDDVKSALSHGPLVTTLTVYEDFMAYGGGVYKHVTGDVEGGHAVSIVGYDNAKRAWLIRNSWGPQWGEDGFAWVSWDDDSGVGANTWSLDVPSNQKSLSIIAPSDREYVSNKYTFTVQTQGVFDSTARIHLKATDGKETLLNCLGAASSKTCAAQLDTTQLSEGRYEIYAESSSVGGLKSQVREFYILNSQPRMTLSFSGDSDVDLTSPLNGRVVFDIHATYAPVPIQRLAFRVVDAQGKIVANNVNDRVLKQMKMGWRTNTLSNGQYKIYIHGETSYNGKVVSVDSSPYWVTTEN